MGNRKILHKLSSLLLTVFFTMPILGTVEADAMFTPSVELYSDSIYMVNLDTDITIFEKNATDRYIPASTTKIMTALVVLERVQNLDEFVEITAHSFNEFHGDNANFYGVTDCALAIGQKNITYRDCLYGLMLASACDAANVLGYNVGGGDIGNFVAMMNEKAAEIGCVNTNFTNTHGLYEKDNYSCAYDMYLITKYAYEKFPIFKEICSTYQYDFPPNNSNPDGYAKYNTNKLVKNNAENPYYYEYAFGIKTGSINEYYEGGETFAGTACLVSMAQKGGYTHLIATLGAPYYDMETEEFGNYTFKDHIALYEWAFTTFQYKLVLSKNDVVATIPVEQGENADLVQLKPMEDYSTLLPVDIDNSAINRDIKLNAEMLVAPVTKGTILGTVDLKIADETLITISLVAADDVALSQTAYLAEKIKGVLNQTWLKVGLVILALLVIALVILRAVNTSKKNKKKKRQNQRIRK